MGRLAPETSETFDSTVEYGEDRIVTYRAYPEEQDCGMGPVTMRIRTYGGHLPAALDLQYRGAVARQLEINGHEVMEVVVTDEPFMQRYWDMVMPTDVHGFYDARSRDSVSI